VVTNAGDHVLFAQWAAKTGLKIIYDANTGSGVMADQVVTFGQSVTLSSNVFAKSGYVFTGWNTVADGSGTSYTNGQVFNYLIDGDLVLYAQWVLVVVDMFIVTYSGNGASGGVAPVDSNGYVSGELVTVLGKGSLVRAGYSFLGWSDSSTASVATFTAGSTFVIYNDVVLYAVWSLDVYTVTYEPGTRGTFAVQVTGGLYYGDATPVAPVVTGAVGWTFTGWLPAVSATVTGDATYVAHWSQISTPTPSPSPSATATATPSPSPSVTATATPTLTLVPSPSLSSTSTPDTRIPPLVVDRWAVVNLVLAVLGVVLVVVVFVRALLLKKKEADDEQGRVGGGNAVAGRGGGQNYAGSGADEQKKFTQRRVVWLVVALVFAVVGVVVFFVTEDMSLSMGWVDRWTVVNTVIFVVTIIASIFVFKTVKQTKNTSNTSSSRTSSSAGFTAKAMLPFICVTG
jgi:uncharacterized repeat protein (TIGR02543 family)